MALSLTRFPWWLLGGKDRDSVSNGTSLNSSLDWGLGVRELDNVKKFPSVKGTKYTSSSKNVKRKWKSREERKVEKEYDVVFVPSDGIGLSGSESDDSDWSIGWLEPHAPDFQSDDDSFAVLVPCYKQGFEESEEGPSIGFFNSAATRNIPNDHYSDGKKYVEQWLSSIMDKSY